MWQWVIERLGTNRQFSRGFSRVGPPIDYWLLKCSRGWLSLMVGKPVGLMTTIGRKSGQPRTHPILCALDGEHIYLIASNFGKTHHPSWFLNLRANPHVYLLLRGRSRDYVARLADEAERERCWEQALKQYRGYSVYQDWAANRTIPIVILDPA